MKSKARRSSQERGVMFLASIRSTVKRQEMSGIDVCAHGTSSQHAFAFSQGDGDDVLVLGLEDRVALEPSGKLPHHIIIHFYMKKNEM